MLISGDVVDVDLGLPTGREAGFPRPAVIVTAQEVLDQLPSVVQIVPLTSTIRDYVAEVTIETPGSGLDHASAAQCQHIRGISMQRIGPIRGNVGTEALRAIREVLARLIDLP